VAKMPAAGAAPLPPLEDDWTSGVAPAPLWTSADVAAYLGISVRWVEDQTRAGNLPDIPVGRQRRYRPEAIKQWVEQRQRAV
jgi:excisionase family DNA binding protein